MVRSHRIIVFLIAVLLTLPGVVTTSALDAGETRLMLSHEARFTARIPVGWDIDLTQQVDYVSADSDGFVAAWSYPAEISSLTKACGLAAEGFGGAVGSITWITFASQIACRLESPSASGSDDEPLGMVFLHPNPLLSGIDGDPYFKFAAIMVDREHFSEVSESMRFDLGDVTPALFLNSAIDILQRYSFVRDEVDWESVRIDAIATGGRGDLQAGIEIALDALTEAGDHHSYLWEPRQLDSFVGTSAQDIPEVSLPTSLAISDQINYINLPPIQGDASVYQLYATVGNQAIAAVDSVSACGWIVDLRTNFGGNVEPMIAAVGEILGGGVFAGRASSNGDQIMEAYRGGSVYDVAGAPGESLIDGPLYTVVHPGSAVAVLIGPVTGSAAEYTAIGFIGRPGTRTFGEPSADLTTGISGFILLDGAAIGLATSAMIDRNGVAYPDGIEPDTFVEFDVPSTMDPSDPVTAAAIEWLEQQPSCR